MTPESLDIHRTKLDEKARQKIFAMIDEGYATALIAKRFGVTWATIYKINKSRIAPDKRKSEREELLPPIVVKSRREK